MFVDNSIVAVKVFFFFSIKVNEYSSHESSNSNISFYLFV